DDLEIIHGLGDRRDDGVGGRREILDAPAGGIEEGRPVLTRIVLRLVLGEARWFAEPPRHGTAEERDQADRRDDAKDLGFSHPGLPPIPGSARSADRHSGASPQAAGGYRLRPKWSSSARWALRAAGEGAGVGYRLSGQSCAETGRPSVSGSAGSGDP